MIVYAFEFVLVKTIHCVRLHRGFVFPFSLTMCFGFSEGRFD